VKAKRSFCALGLGALLLLPGAAASDWLVTREGARVETRGPWQVKGKLVVFTQPDGTLASLRVSQVDLDASAQATKNAVEEAAAAEAIKASQTAEPVKKKSRIVLTDADFAKKPEAPAAADGEGEDKSQAVSPQGREGDAERKTPVVVSTWRQAERTEGDGIDVFGVLQNTGNALATGVALTVELYNDTGERVGSAVASLSAPGIRPGGSITFRAAFPNVFTFTEARFHVDSQELNLAPLPPEQPADGQSGTAGASGPPGG
jgi:hypothetical protein